MRRLPMLVGTGAATAMLLVTAACGGSALGPAQVRAANEALAGQAAGAPGTSTTGTGTGTTGTGGTDSTGTGTGTTGTGATGTGGGSGTGGTGSTGSGGSGSGTGGAVGSGGSTGGSATQGVHKGSCAGFKNQTGITNSTITIGNTSDISGPVPGLFTSAQQAVKAYVAYFNATSSICGRKLALITQDSKTDGSADQQAYASLCSSSFAAVGSMSAFDSGGAATAQQCGIPDIRTATTTNERNACTTCFAAQGSNANYYENAPAKFFVQHNPAAAKKAALIYVNAGGAVDNANTIYKVFPRLGIRWAVKPGIGISTSDVNYGPYVQKMKDAGVRYVIIIGPYQYTVRMEQTMQQQNFKPDVFLQDPTIYEPDFVQQAGSAGEGTYVYMNFLPFEQASSNAEMSAYLKWLQQVAPGAAPSFYGVFAWSAAALFTQEATELGGKLTRASMVNALRGVHNWSAHGMTAPQDVGGKVNGSCWRFVQLRHGKWVPVGGGYQCDGVTRG